MCDMQWYVCVSVCVRAYVLFVIHARSHFVPRSKGWKDTAIVSLPVSIASQRGKKFSYPETNHCGFL